LFAIATVIFGELAAVLVSNFTPFGSTIGLAGMPLVVGMGWGMSVLAGAVVIELFVLRRTTWDLEVRALADSRNLIDLAGKSSRLLQIVVFTLSGTVAGLAGAMQVHFDGSIAPGALQFNASLSLLVFAVVGGPQSRLGPFIAAFGLTVLVSELSLNSLGTDLIYGALLLVVTVIRPSGLLTRRHTRVVPSPGSTWFSRTKTAPPATPANDPRDTQTLRSAP
jgi:branched-chain amino acid transport system permease protein